MGSNEMVQHTKGVETGNGNGGLMSGKRSKLSSVLTYSPSVMGMGGGGGGGNGNGGNVGDNDYGTVTCRASNSAGQQIEPCVFHVIAAGECLQYLTILLQLLKQNQLYDIL